MYRYSEMKEMLLADIKKMKPLTKLISRPKLCEKYGVTRTTTDRAIAELTNEKVLYSIKGSGTYVAAPQFAERPTVLKKPGDTMVWGVILPDIMYDLYTAILRGISDIAAPDNINVMLFNTDNDTAKQHGIVENLLVTGVDGLIIIPAISNDINLATYMLLREKNIPFVFCNRGIDTLPEVPLVCCNNFYGGYIAVKHLIELGYRHIAFLSKLRYRTALDRYLGYCAAIMEAGLPLNRKLVTLSFEGDDRQGAFDATCRLLQHRPEIDSIFCVGDLYLQGVYDAISANGLRVSDDIGVVSHDNSTICERVTPKATSTSFKGYEAGYQAALLLNKLMKGETLNDINLFVMQPELVVRDSCKGLQE